MTKFDKISRIYLMGGGKLLYEFSKYLTSKFYEVYVFTSKRHAEDPIFEGQTLKDLIDAESIPFFQVKDIESSEKFLANITPRTLGFGFGEDWTFSKAVIDRFDGKLLDIMGIRLPQYRGGAHYSWQIMRRNRIGACNLQIINEEMVQGIFDSGEIIKTREYLFPISAIKPQDYFDYAQIEELSFLKEFIEEIEQGKAFPLMPVPENYSIYFPRLYTPKHGWIDWSWGIEDIATFIRAFDDPYPGASTYLDGEQVKIKEVRIEYNDGPFHPFQSGLIYKKTEAAIYIATRDGTLIAGKILDESGESSLRSISVGQRLFTPYEHLEKAMSSKVAYDANGIKNI